MALRRKNVETEIYGVRCTEAVWKKMRAAAKKKEVTQSEFVETAIKEAIKRVEEEIGKKLRGLDKRPYNKKAA